MKQNKQDRFFVTENSDNKNLDVAEQLEQVNANIKQKGYDSFNNQQLEELQQYQKEVQHQYSKGKVRLDGVLVLSKHVSKLEKYLKNRISQTGNHPIHAENLPKSKKQDSNPYAIQNAFKAETLKEMAKDERLASEASASRHLADKIDKELEEDLKASTTLTTNIYKYAIGCFIFFLYVIWILIDVYL